MARTQVTFTRTAQSGGLTHLSDVAALVAAFNNLSMRYNTRALNSGGLAIGSSDPAKIKIASTIVFLINGTIVSLSTAEYAVPVGATMANTTGAKDVWCAVSTVDGVNVVVTAGTVALAGATAVKPTVPDDAALIGWVRIQAATATTFTPGSTQLSAAGITDTYVDALADPREITELVPTQ